jgi:peroxiredoxin
MVATLVGKKAREFDLRDTAGIRHCLADFAGSWLLLVFHRHLA